MTQIISKIRPWFSTQRLASLAIALLLCLSVPSNLIAYDIDFEMDQARKEKTIEHYGEGIRDVVEDATDNNVNNPDSKETAKNSYERESQLNDVLPKQIGQDFSKADLSDLEN